MLAVAQLRATLQMNKPGSVAEASEPGIFAEVEVSVEMLAPEPQFGIGRSRPPSRSISAR